MTPQQINERALSLAHAGSKRSVAITLPMQYKARKNELMKVARANYHLLCSKNVPCRITYTQHNSMSISFVLGLATKLSDFSYRQKFITYCMLGISEPVDILVFTV